jgi:uncharacterized membrane protein YgcG
MKHIFLLLGFTLLFIGCMPKKYKQKVHVYKVQNSGGSSTESKGDDFIYFYMIMSDNGSCSYTYSSTTPVTNFSGVSWTAASVRPVPPNAQEEATEEISETELPAEVESEMEANTTENSSETSEDASTDAGGESSSGSSDASGGDGGGGDGGGGD